MRYSKALAKLRAGKAIKLAYTGHVLPLYIAHAAANGFDAIWLDLEHRPMNPREVQLMLAHCHLYDIDAIVRVPTREKTLLYRYLEDGATGVIIPLVESAEEARDIVSKVKFPPLGDRGLEGKGIDASFGLDTADGDAKARFIQHANAETLIVIQLESPSAIAQAETIAAVEGVDVIFAGPTDFGIRAKEGDMGWGEALQRVASAAHQQGKAWGVMPRNAEQVSDYARQGAVFMPWALDAKLLIDGIGQASRELDKAYGS